MEQQAEFGMVFYRLEGVVQIHDFRPPRFISLIIWPILGICLMLTLSAALVFATTGTQQQRGAFHAGFATSVMMGMMMRTAK